MVSSLLLLFACRASEDLTPRVEALESDVAALEGAGTDVDVSSLQAADAQNAADVDGLEARVSTLEVVTDFVEGALFDVQEELGALLGRLDATDAAVSGLDVRVDDTEAATADLNERTDEVEASAADLSARTSTLEGAATGVAAALADHESRLDTLESDAAADGAATSDALAALDAEVGGLASDVGALDASLGALSSTVDGLVADLSSLGVSFTALSADLSVVDAAVDALTITTDGLAASLAALASRVDSLEAALGGLDTTTAAATAAELANLTAVVEALEGDVDALPQVPVGTVVDWYRPSASTPSPDGWQLMNGSLVTDPDSVYYGQTLPDLTDRFTRGVVDQSLVGVSSGSSSHVHGVDLTHGHSASASSDGAHAHTWASFNGSGTDWYSGDGAMIMNWTDGMDNAGSGYYALATSGGTATYYTSSNGSHDHTIYVANSTASTATSSQSHLPPYVGMVKIIRIR
jgi:hypothetical protein